MSHLRCSSGAVRTWPTGQYTDRRVRIRHGHTECAHCGTTLDLQTSQKPLVMIHTTSGQPAVRVLYFHGDEIHRCVIHPEVVTFELGDLD